MIPRDPDDEDAGVAFACARAFEVDTMLDVDPAVEDVDANSAVELSKAEDTSSQIGPRVIGVRAFIGVGVRGIHVADCVSQIRRNVCIAQDEGLTIDQVSQSALVQKM